ncbi:hypothetical protein ACF0H5_019098 [Mactra antiquata]
MNPWSWNENAKIDAAKMSLIPIAVLTLITNILVIFIFVRKKMMSALNVILVGISISDTLTVLIPAIAVLFSYMDGVYPDYIPSESCRIWGYLTKYFPTITHNASVWLTVILAFDRYLVIRHPFLIRRICLPRTSLVVIVMIYLCAILCNICRFIDTEYVPVKIIPVSAAYQYYNTTLDEYHSNFTSGSDDDRSTSHPHVNMHKLCKESEGIETCRAVYTPFFAKFEGYEFCYYWFVILFVKFLPCSAMIILDTLMIQGLRQAESFRHFLSLQCTNRFESHIRSKYYESRRMTKVVIVAVIIVIIVELPIGIILILWTLSEIHDYHIITERTLSRLSRAANGVVYISYPIIFLLYCSVSAQFRNAICNLHPCRRLAIFKRRSSASETSDG